MNNVQPVFQIGDIVTCSKRRNKYVYRITDIEYDMWELQHVQWGQCTQAQVGTPRSSQLKLQSIFELSIPIPIKSRKAGFWSYPSCCTKLDPQQILDFIQGLNKFLVDTWP